MQRNGVIESDEDASVNRSSLYEAQIGERLRVRIQVDSTGLATMSARLEYSEDGGTWTAVTAQNKIRPARSTIIKGKYTNTGSEASGACTTGADPGHGYMYENRGKSDAITFGELTVDKCREITFTVDTKNATNGSTYRFRLYNSMAASALNQYYVYPTVKVISSSQKNPPQKKFAKANTLSLPTANPATGGDLPYFLDDKGYKNTERDDNVYEVLQNVTAPSGSKADTTANTNIYGTEDSQYLGISVSSAGDVNGDGYDDVIVGANQANAGGTDRGRAYIFFGGTGLTGLKADTTADVDIYGTENNSQYLGVSVSSAGDVNGDGYDDVIVGANGANVGGTSRGRAYIFFGGPGLTGLKADTTADVNIYGTENNSQSLGDSVSSAGDVNGDGYDDVIVGANGANVGGTFRGRAYIFFGGASLASRA
jgi:hypothetical protein